MEIYNYGHFGINNLTKPIYIAVQRSFCAHMIYSRYNMQVIAKFAIARILMVPNGDYGHVENFF